MDALTFRVADGEYAIDLLRVQEVSMGVPVTRVPGAPAAVRGVVNLRGNVVPMVDLSVRLAGPGVTGTGRAAVLFVKARLGAEVTVVGLMVDAVRTVLSIAESEIVDRSAVPGLAGAEVVSGLAMAGKALIPILDVDALLSLEALASCHAAGSSVAAGEQAGEGVLASAAGKVAAVPEPERLPAVAAGGPLRTPEPGGATSTPLPSVPESPRASAPARTGGAPPSPSATAPVPMVARQPSAPVSRHPPLPLSPLGAGARSIEPQAWSLVARGWEVQGIGPAAPALEARERRRWQPGKSPEERGARWGWIAGSSAAVALAVLAALLLGRGGPSTLDRRSELAPPSRSDAPAAPPGRPTAPTVIERAEALRPMGATIERAETVGPAPPGPVATGAPGELVHEVRRGDTLWDLSRRYYGDPLRWPAIFDVNRDLLHDPDLILPSDHLRIPAGPALPGGSGGSPGR